ncbi:MAG: hypothetical protein ACRD36_06540, partial [Candidatus Acidiferrum sp.]
MATLPHTTTEIPVTQEQAPAAKPAQSKIPVPKLIEAMLKSGEHVSDLIFSPGRAPQVEISGSLVQLKFKGLECLTAQ